MFPSMAPGNGTAGPRKKVATYGKGARKRIPQYQAPAKVTKVQTSETEAVQTDEAESSSQPSPKSPTTVTSPVKRSIFDVPSSDEEDFTARRPEKKKKTPAARVPKKSAPETQKEKEDEGMAIMQSRKRVKLSPAPAHISKQPLRQLPVTKAQSMVAVAKMPPKVVQKVAAKVAPKVATKSTLPNSAASFPGSGHTTSIVSRPRRNDRQSEREAAKPVAIANGKKLENKAEPKIQQKVEKTDINKLQTPKKTAPPLRRTPQRKISSPDFADIDMMDVDLVATPGSGRRKLSPKGLQLWDDLLVSASEQAESPIGTKAASSGMARLGLGGSPVVSTGAKQAGSRPQMPRRRLIDSLVAQIPKEDLESEDEDESMDDDDSSSATNSSRSQSPAPEVVSRPDLPADSQTLHSSQTTGPKITYSRQRSMLEEEDIMLQLSQPLPDMPEDGPKGRRRLRRASMPKLPKLASFREEDDDGEGAGATIRSVHELRAAGANTRVLDEIQDLIDRIGKPTPTQGSGRRAGLLELAKQLKDKAFSRHFFAESTQERLFVGLGQETDTIAGFILVSILITVLGEVDVLPFVLQLRRQGITRLLIRLLDVQSSVVLVAKDRKSNTSKVAQKMVSDHHEYVKGLAIWEPLEPKSLSPRTLALKCLEIMTEQTREARSEAEIFSKELTTRLFTILKSASDERSWGFPGHQSIDFYLALSALTAHSTRARTVQDEKIWITNFLPTISDTLKIALSQSLQSHGPLHTLIFSLTINVTNNNAKACDVFAQSALIREMSKYAVAKFQQISGFMLQADSEMAVNQLILILASMINFADQDSKARASMDTSLLEEGNDTLEEMVTIWAGSQDKISEASSMEETEKLIPFGYLGVLLGYLALVPEISKRIRKKLPGQSLRSLISSIEEFMMRHSEVDSQIQEGDMFESEESKNTRVAMTRKLEKLLEQLGTR
ncbi:hypothetical protein HYFRA_00001899 [Hymenoscyphus fraxineus]|uniref:Wings apart-like protein C-terminal domain-containing protein n=1 Tax=Hymenoscyphus fraxineus TaxID=746836 RepID=A0A9N9KNL8_9HELO|nr:hypothetical protein HYFRA_00001899 [Hymenoscyphus fraxineus]